MRRIRLCALAGAGMLAAYILLDDPAYPAIQCLMLSRAAMKGRKKELFLLDLSYLPWMLLCVLTLGVLMIWLMPYIRVTDLGVYAFCSRENGAEVMPTPAEESVLPGEM